MTKNYNNQSTIKQGGQTHGYDQIKQQQLAFDGFIDVMVQIYKMTSDKIDYSKLEKDKDKENNGDGAEDKAEA